MKLVYFFALFGPVLFAIGYRYFGGPNRSGAPNQQAGPWWLWLLLSVFFILPVLIFIWVLVVFTKTYHG